MIEKKEFVFIDYFKFLCALLVVSIHLAPFCEISEDFSYWFNHVICRLAVPFFFMSSGFFLANKLHDKRKVYSYIVHILILYMLYSVLHMDIVLKIEGYSSNIGVCEKMLHFLKILFVEGSYVQLWYLIGLIIATLLLWATTRICKSDKVLFGVAVLIYVIGALGNGYFDLFGESITGNELIEGYYSFFRTTRNGFFFGFPFVAIGYLMRKNAERIHNKGSFEGFIISLVLFYIEARIVYYFNDEGYKDMLLMLLPVAVLFFKTIAFIDCKSVILQSKALLVRNLSTFIYVSHMLVSFYAAGFLWGRGIYMSYLERYIFVVVVCVITGYIVIKLSEKKPLKFLHILY